MLLQDGLLQCFTYQWLVAFATQLHVLSHCCITTFGLLFCHHSAFLVMNMTIFHPSTCAMYMYMMYIVYSMLCGTYTCAYMYIHVRTCIYMYIHVSILLVRRHVYCSCTCVYNFWFLLTIHANVHVPCTCIVHISLSLQSSTETTAQ